MSGDLDSLPPGFFSGAERGTATLHSILIENPGRLDLAAKAMAESMQQGIAEILDLPPLIGEEERSAVIAAAQAEIDFLNAKLAELGVQ